MQLRKISYIKLFITFFITTISFARVTLEIKNVDLNANTLDIYMANTASCSYCPDPTYNNNTQNWVDQKDNEDRMLLAVLPIPKMWLNQKG